MRVTIEARRDGRGIIAADAAADFHYVGVGRQPRSPIAVEAR